MKSGNDFGNKEEWLEYLRTYFSGLAMQGMIAEWNGEHVVKEMAKRAVGAADALIKELNKES